MWNQKSNTYKQPKCNTFGRGLGCAALVHLGALQYKVGCHNMWQHMISISFLSFYLSHVLLQLVIWLTTFHFLTWLSRSHPLLSHVTHHSMIHVDWHQLIVTHWCFTHSILTLSFVLWLTQEHPLFLLLIVLMTLLFSVTTICQRLHIFSQFYCIFMVFTGYFVSHRIYNVHKLSCDRSHDFVSLHPSGTWLWDSPALLVQTVVIGW